jgi:hypothetical protein
MLADDNGLREELQRKTLPNDLKKAVDDFGIVAGLRDSASSLSTAAFSRYAIAIVGQILR